MVAGAWLLAWSVMCWSPSKALPLHTRATAPALRAPLSRRRGDALYALNYSQVESIVNDYFSDKRDKLSWEELTKRVIDFENDGSSVSIPEIDMEVLEKEMQERYKLDFANPEKVYGIMNGLDDPRDVFWRLKAEELVRGAVRPLAGVRIYDVCWNIATLQVLLEQETDEGGTVDLKVVETAHRAILDALEAHDEELQILTRHELEVSSKGAKNILDSEREFEAFKGFDVVVKTLAPDGIDKREPLYGKLVGRDVHETTINIRGRPVRIPNHLVEEVRLPEANEEPVENLPPKNSKAKRKPNPKTVKKRGE